MDAAQKMKVVPSIMAESTYMLEGRPFRLKNRKYLIPIYNGNIDDGIIMSGRQVEKSTTNSTHMANYTITVPFFRGLYVAPLTSQVREFSRERIGKLYEYSQDDIVKKNFIDKDCAQAVGLKEFTNGAVNYFKHCYGLADNIRGITVNGIWIDEIQDIHIDAIPVIAETQSHAVDTGAGFKLTWKTGTPKTFSNTIQQYWDKSTQAEWIVKCPHCGEYQILGVKNLTPTAFVCRKCKKELPQVVIANGFWKELQPGKSLRGFRISQLMVPWITADDIWKKYITYSTDKFYNEVLGRSYENADKPFNPLMLAQISKNDYRLYPRAEREFANTENFMGVDWGTGGTSYTVVVIFSRNAAGKLQMIYCKRYEQGEELDPEWQLRDIMNTFQLFRCKYGIVDWGFGYDRYKKMQNVFGSRIAACYYSFNLKTERRWDRHENRWIVNRTEVINNYITAVKNLDIAWPGLDTSKFTWLFDNHLVEQAEYRKSINGKSEDLLYTHPEGQPDDGLHASIYAFLASIYYRFAGNPETIRFGSAYGNV